MFWHQQVVIEAVRGRGWKGDIAIDDSRTVDGPCTPQGSFIAMIIIILFLIDLW